MIYAVKLAAYIGGWLAFCAITPSLGGLSTITAWGLAPLAFEKAILWSMMFEVLGFGCGSGPLTGRYSPPVGGFLYFLRPGTTKLPLVRIPRIGGDRRTLLDVALYLALLIALGRVLVAPDIAQSWLAAIVILVVVASILDRTIFLACRGEHYWTTAVCFLFAGNWIAGAKAVQLALWFWAGVSKLNHHFPAVVCVMTSNSPVLRWRWLRERMYRKFPEDLRPSRLATTLSHIGTAFELGVPIVLATAGSREQLIVGLVLMVMLHGFITSNVPMGVPIEWNVMVVYGAFALFWAHPAVGVGALGSIPLAIGLVIALVAVPLAGNLWPHAFSFLLAMRYYAGNWAFSVWLFRGESSHKLSTLTTTAPWIYDQTALFYDRATAVGLVGRVMAFRLMHLHGRTLPLLIPKAVDDFTAYEYVEGEMIAGLVLGWNFGDGHLHSEPLLGAIQRQCEFEPGELRCIFVESQPLGRSTMDYRIVDAATGELERGTLQVAELRSRQPWAAT